MQMTMKTKNIITLLAALPLMAAFTACSSDTESEASAAKEQLIVEEGSEIVMLGQEESAVMNITADCGWRVEQDLTNSNFDDLAIRPMSGSGSATLSIKATKNPGAQVRASYVTVISDGGLKRRIKIRQRSGNENMEISESSLNFQASGTPQLSSQSFFNITSNISWNITIPTGVNWVHLDKTSLVVPAGSPSIASTINVSVDPLQTDAARTARLIISFGSGTPYYVTIRQDGVGTINLSVSPKELSYYTNWASGERQYEPTYETQEVGVTSNAYWRVIVPSSAQSWLKVDPMEGAGNATLKVTCPPYAEYGKTRYTMFFVVAGTENPIMQDIFVQQTASQYVEPSHYDEPHGSSSDPVSPDQTYDPNRP